jgi:Resolvase, N terminal domain
VNGFGALPAPATLVAARSRTKRTQAKKAAPSGPAFARREGHLIGYARVSTTGQDTEAKLKAAGCTLIRTETVSGASRNGHNGLASILDFIRPGDVLIVVKLDRLGRNTRDILNLLHELAEKGASLWVLEPAIDTGGPMGRMVLTVLGMVAEMELGFIRDRQAVDAETVRRRAPASRAGSLLNRSRLASRANLHGACPNRPCAAWTKSVRGDHCPECVNPID